MKGEWVFKPVGNLAQSQGLSNKQQGMPLRGADRVLLFDRNREASLQLPNFDASSPYSFSRLVEDPKSVPIMIRSNVMASPLIVPYSKHWIYIVEMSDRQLISEVGKNLN